MKYTLLLLSVVYLSTPLVYADEKEELSKSLERRQKAEFMAYFLRDAGDADLPKATLGIQAYNRAVSYFQANEFELAREEANKALAQDDLNPLIYELLGDLDDREQKLKEAKANYQIAYSLKPTKSLKEKIEGLLAETKVDKKLKTYTEEHFIIKYNDKEQAYQGFELREILRKTYRQISKDFAFYFRHQIVVLLLDQEDFKKVTNLPHWAAGVYDGKVRIPVDQKGLSDIEFKALTTHEVTHAFVSAMSSMRAPAWINEGLAEYEENKVRPNDTIVFESAVKTNALHSLDALMAVGSTITIKDALMVTLFYQQSYHLVNYLIDRYGMFKVKELLRAFGKGMNSNQAINDVLKISVKRLEKEWLASIKK